MKSIEQRLATLEQQVAALAQSAQGEQLVPNYLTVSPSGVVTAVFNGGVTIPEQPTGTPSIPNSFNFQSAGAIKEFFLGCLEGPLHVAAMGSLSDTDDFANVSAWSQAAGGAGGSAIELEASDSDGSAVLIALDSLGRSGFLQLGVSELSTSGADTLTWPGGNQASGTKNVKLSGASGTVVAVAVATSLTGFSAPIMVAEPDGAGGVNFFAETASGNPPAGSQATFAYLMWGS